MIIYCFYVQPENITFKWTRHIFESKSFKQRGLCYETLLRFSHSHKSDDFSKIFQIKQKIFQRIFFKPYFYVIINTEDYYRHTGIRQEKNGSIILFFNMSGEKIHNSLYLANKFCVQYKYDVISTSTFRTFIFKVTLGYGLEHLFIRLCLSKKAIRWGSHSNETETPYHTRLGTIKIPLWNHCCFSICTFINVKS